MLFPFPLALFPFPFPFPSWAVWLFPFPWDSHGNGIPMGFPTPMHTSSTRSQVGRCPNVSRQWRLVTLWIVSVLNPSLASCHLIRLFCHASVIITLQYASYSHNTVNKILVCHWFEVLRFSTIVWHRITSPLHNLLTDCPVCFTVPFGYSALPFVISTYFFPQNCFT